MSTAVQLNDIWLLWQTNDTRGWKNKFQLMTCADSFTNLKTKIANKTEGFTFGNYLANNIDVEGKIWDKNLDGFYICNGKLLQKNYVNNSKQEQPLPDRFKPDFFYLKGLRYKKYFSITDNTIFDQTYNNIIDKIQEHQEHQEHCYCLCLYNKKSLVHKNDQDKYKREWNQQNNNQNNIFIQQLWKYSETETETEDEKKAELDKAQKIDISKFKEKEALIIEIWTNETTENENITKLFNLNKE